MSIATLQTVESQHQRTFRYFGFVAAIRLKVSSADCSSKTLCVCKDTLIGGLSPHGMMDFPDIFGCISGPTHATRSVQVPGMFSRTLRILRGEEMMLCLLVVVAAVVVAAAVV